MTNGSEDGSGNEHCQGDDGLDAEVNAIQVASKALEGLSVHARARVVAWVADKHLGVNLWQWLRVEANAAVAAERRRVALEEAAAELTAAEVSRQQEVES